MADEAEVVCGQCKAPRLVPHCKDRPCRWAECRRCEAVTDLDDPARFIVALPRKGK